MAAEPRKSDCCRSNAKESFTERAGFTGVSDTAVIVSSTFATKPVGTGTIGVEVFQQTLAQCHARQDA